MQELSNFVRENSIKKLLAIFPHPDDESFVAGGLFQNLEDLKIDTKLICLTRGGRGINHLGSGNLKKIRQNELRRACEILSIDDFEIYDFPDAELKDEIHQWRSLLKRKISEYKPDAILTFDYSGITGHPDHIVTCDEVRKLVNKSEGGPILIWRCPDEKEKKYFAENEALKFAATPNLVAVYDLKKSLRKIRAILSHRSQIKNFFFKLHIFEWFIFNHREFYYVVDLKRHFKFRFVYFKID